MKIVEYDYNRFCFKADVIEPLEANDVFVMRTPDGTFQFTKADFYRVFDNVVKSKSYQEARIYHSANAPQKANQFRIGVSGAQKSVPYFSRREVKKSEEVLKRSTDLVGDEIRSKIREVGRLWRNSENNPPIKKDILLTWGNLIDEWIADKTMPLIVRKDVSKRGQSVIHSSGREIIVSDNTFATWVFWHVLHNKTLTLLEVKQKLFNNEIPMVYALPRESKGISIYTKSIGQYALLGWKLCHIEQIGFNTSRSIEELEIGEIKAHFRKYANPNNMFVLPKEIGDIGEIDVFIEEQKR